MAAITVAAVQLVLGEDRDALLEKTAHYIGVAASTGARLVVLPERFAQWESDQQAAESAEGASRRLADWLSGEASRFGIYLVGGSIIERASGSGLPFNTCLLFGPDGAMTGAYRKIHLFDAIVDGVTHGESNTITAGNETVCVDTTIGAVGLSICYDVRFPELYRALVDKGAEILTVPAGFTRVTGMAHWEVLIRARAIENQCYVVAAGMSGRTSPSRDFFGHSMIVDPWGTVIAQLDEGDGVVTAQIDLETVQQVRAKLPALNNRRLGHTVLSKASALVAGI
jgi:deaminated glutathione amidase